MKSVLKRALRAGITGLGSHRFGRFVQNAMVENAMAQTRRVDHDGASLTFTVPNDLNQFRIDTFSTKEPETLQWIDRIPEGATVWDIGANVGLYSCYAAKRRRCRVFAFEPSVFNLELLARNVFLNGVTDRVTLVPLAVSDGLAVSTLNMTSTEWGGALSTFGQGYGFDGQPLKKVFEFSTIGISLDQAADELGIPLPDFIKLDVDGIEHLILKGGAAVLGRARGVLVEINDGFQQQAVEATGCLEAAGLVLAEKRRWQESIDGPHQATYNQIWQRPA